MSRPLLSAVGKPSGKERPTVSKERKEDLSRRENGEGPWNDGESTEQPPMCMTSLAQCAIRRKRKRRESRELTRVRGIQLCTYEQTGWEGRR